jgi:lipoteichoic acid synthase
VTDSAAHIEQVRAQRHSARLYHEVGWTAAALAPFLVAIRGRVTGLGWGGLLAPHLTIPKAIVAAYYDLALLAAVTAAAFGLAWLLRRRGGRATVVAKVHLGLALFILAAASVNVVAVSMLRRPFTYQWLYYSDFLQSRASYQAASSVLTPQALAIFALTVAAFLALRLVLLRWADRRALAGGRVRGRSMLAVALVGSLLYFAGAGHYLATRAMWRPGTLENPIIAFARSLAKDSVPVIFTMDPGVSPADVLVGWERGEQGVLRPASEVEAEATNVLVVILESAGAPYYDLYGGSHGIDRHLMARRKDMRVFTSIYAHAPATNKAMLSILCATYPLISFQTLTREHPTLPLGCLSSELKRHGYRTGYFGSSDLRFQRAEEFLAARSFDVIEGFRERTCDLPIIAHSTEDWPHADASDDGCTAASTAAWIEEDPETPFFAVMWTAMAHFPYYAPPPEVDYGVGNPFLNRYLNALSYADRVVEEVLRRIEAAGLAESTLIVIMGDHGESFGHRGYYFHSSIYEDTARVPFILLQPGRFHGEEDHTVGGLVDLAPTVTDLLGLPPHGDWQGRSLFDPGRGGRAYFYSPWSDYLFGVREGPLKYILNATTGEYKMYNVVADPDEVHNVIAEHPGAEEQMQRRMAAWVQYQQELWDRRLRGLAVEQ